jgi:hypothetical protein
VTDLETLVLTGESTCFFPAIRRAIYQGLFNRALLSHLVYKIMNLRVHAFQNLCFNPKQKNYELRRTGPTDNVQANIYNPKNKSALHMAASIIVHPHYNGVSKVADLAVLKFAENLDENLTAICLSNKPGRVKMKSYIFFALVQNIWQSALKDIKDFFLRIGKKRICYGTGEINREIA